MLIPCKEEQLSFFSFLLVWRSSSVEFAFHTTTCSCCINNSRAALPNQHVRFTDARTQTQQEPSQRVHRADIDMHERIRLHVPLFPSQHQSGFLKLSSWLLCQPLSKEMNIHRMNVGLLTSLPTVVQLHWIALVFGPIRQPFLCMLLTVSLLICFLSP